MHLTKELGSILIWHILKCLYVDKIWSLLGIADKWVISDSNTMILFWVESLLGTLC